MPYFLIQCQYLSGETDYNYDKSHLNPGRRIESRTSIIRKSANSLTDTLDTILAGEPHGKRSLGRPKRRWKDEPDIKICSPLRNRL